MAARSLHSLSTMKPSNGLMRTSASALVIMACLSPAAATQVEPAPPTRTIEGTVYDLSGAPAAGATVSIASPSGRRVYRLTRGTSSPSNIIRKHPEPDLVTETDDQGRFSFTAVPTHGRRITASHLSGSRAVTFIDPEPADALELHLKRTTRITGTTTDGAGSPSAGASIHACLFQERSPLDWVETTSGEDGAFALEGMLPGVWKVVMLSETGRRLDRELTVKDGENDPVELRFPVAGSVSGRIRGLSVADTPDLTPLVNGQPCSARVSSDSRFLIEELEGGVHVISASRQSTGEATRPVEVEIVEEGQMVAVELVFPDLLAMSGRATCGEIGAPGMRVEVFGPGSAMTTTNDDGSWIIKGLEPGNYSVDFLDTSMAVVARQDVWLDQATQLLTDVPCHDLGGVVVTPAGFPVPGAAVALDLLSSGQQVVHTRSRPDGTFSIAGLPPGRFSLRAELGDRLSDEYLIDLLDNLTDLEVVLDVSEGLELQVFEPTGEPAQRVAIHPMQGNRVVRVRTTDCSEHGRCHFEDLPFGRYHVLVKGWQGSAALRVVVPSDVVTVHLLHTGVLEIRLAPEVPIDGQMVRVFDESRLIMPPASFLDTWAWQPLNGLLTMDLPEGNYVVEMRTADGLTGVARVGVPGEGRAAVVLEPDS